MTEAIQLLPQLVSSQAQRQGVGQGDRAVSARDRDFISLNPHQFYGSKPDEVPQGFIDRMLRTLRIIHASDTEMDIAHIQAHAQNLEKQQQPQGGECDFDKGHRKSARSFSASSKYRGGQKQQYSRPHSGQCCIGSGACYACGRIGHMMRDCLLRNGENGAQPTGSTVGSSSSIRPVEKGWQVPVGCGRGRGGASSSSGHQNCIYALAERQDLESSPDADTCRLPIFYHDICALIDSSSTLLYATSYIARGTGVKLGLIKYFKVFH
ncbi:uncharacterized protein LOC132637537 [Lycium barbarum]|uniref:uncharacterized protein LOC132637537 n=1 Tax=Lycium barbarum TaxID=112863 RepID=UPI00293E4D5B|nr:uncharacterized protein LOC132637537 [Lycium barbarum]